MLTNQEQALPAEAANLSACKQTAESQSSLGKMSEELLLQWNDHHNVFFVGALSLCEHEEFTDVTLAAGNRFFSAHKLVLSICSPYFSQLFKHLGTGQPVVYLKDADPKLLDLLLQYMYQGEIKVQVKFSLFALYHLVWHLLLFALFYIFNSWLFSNYY